MTTVITPINSATDVRLAASLSAFMLRDSGLAVVTRMRGDGLHWVTRTSTGKEIRWDQVGKIKAFIAGFRAAKELS